MPIRTAKGDVRPRESDGARARKHNVSEERLRAESNAACGTAVKFDVWLGDGTEFGEVVQVASVILPPFSGGKWYYAGFFSVEQFRVDCDGPLQRKQQSGLEMCITWQTTGQLVDDPRGLDQHPVRLVLADSSSTQGSLHSLLSFETHFACWLSVSKQGLADSLSASKVQTIPCFL